MSTQVGTMQMTNKTIRIRGHVRDDLCVEIQCMMFDGVIDVQISPPFPTREIAEKELREAVKAYMMTMSLNFGHKALVIVEPGKFEKQADVVN